MTIYYPDISGWNGPPVTSPLSLKGAIAVQAKATEGTYMHSTVYLDQKAEAARQGAFFLAYHFLIAGNGAGQAEWCFNHVGPNVGLSLDIESGPNNSHPSMSDALSFIDAYRRHGGIIHLMYLPHWYWQGNWGSPSLQPFIDRKIHNHSSAYTRYTDSNSGAGWQPYGGMTPAIWQYTDRMPFNGQNVDFSAFRGSYAGKQDPASVKACLGQLKAMALGRSAPATHHASYAGDGDVYFEVDGLVDFDSSNMWQATIKGVRSPGSVHPSFRNAKGKAYFKVPGHFSLDHGSWSGSVSGRPAP